MRDDGDNDLDFDNDRDNDNDFDFDFDFDLDLDLDLDLLPLPMTSIPPPPFDKRSSCVASCAPSYGRAACGRPLSPSSRGPGLQLFTLLTGVRIPLGTLNIVQK